MILGGLGGADKENRISDSPSVLAQYLLRNNCAPVAFENPIYFRAGEHGHSAFLEKYGTLEAQLTWLYQVLNSVVAEVKRAPNADKISIGVFAFSKESMILLQALDEFNFGNWRADVLQEINWIVLGSVFGHDFESASLWRGSELAAEKEPGFEDAVRSQFTGIASQMSWALPNDFELLVNRELPRAPRVVALTSDRGELIPRRWQSAVVQRFSSLHPGFSVTEFMTDTSHDAVLAIEYKNNLSQDVYRTPMRRLGQVLLSEMHGNIPKIPGYHFRNDAGGMHAGPQLCGKKLVENLALGIRDQLGRITRLLTGIPRG